MLANRREFIARAGTLAAASSTFIGGSPLIRRSGEKSDLESLRIAVIGFRSRGKALINAIEKCSDAKLVALADVDEKVLRETNSADSKLARTKDFRELLQRDDIDAIASAAPNHWHALISIQAAQSGKHVYIEKPISHNMFESQMVVAAADRFDKLIQCGFQNRSDSGLTGFYGRLRAGEFGKVQHVHGTCHRPRKGIGKIDKPLAIPGELDYDLWLGPAAKQDIMRPRLHYDWHWDFNTGNGDVGNQGPHEWDMMNWALGDGEALPEKIQASGNRFAWQDAGNTPNIMACRGVMDGIPFLFEVMDLTPGCKPPHDNRVGVVIKTEKGQFVGSRGGGKFIYTDGKEESFKRDAATQKQDGTRAHMANFVDAVLTNDRSKLRSDCKVAAKSSSMAHMANISYQLGQSAEQGQLETAYSGSEQERDMLQRLMTAPGIYSKKHQSDVSESWKLGPELTFDNANKMFKGTQAEPANQKMTREYRKGFELPSMQMQSKAG